MSEPLQLNIEQFDFTVNLLEAILWQYDESTNILSLINQKQEWYNTYQTEFWSNWYNYVFYLGNPQLTTNPDTEDLALFGLAVWSIILNVPLFIDFSPESPTKPIWGFNKYDPSFPTLENTYWNFYGADGLGGIGANFSTKGQLTSLTLAQQQFLLLLRYFQLITRDNIMSLNTSRSNPMTQVQGLKFYPCSINDFLYWLCNTLAVEIGYSGTIYVLDNLDMTMTYTFTANDFPPNLLDAITQLDLFPRSAGVEALTNVL